MPNTRRSPRTARVIILLLALLISSSTSWTTHSPARAAAGQTGVITGSVRDAATGQPIQNAILRVADRITSTAADGSIGQIAIAIDGPAAQVDVLVTAPSYARWQYDDLDLSSEHTVELRVELSDQPQIMSAPVSAAAAPFDGPPDYITIGRTFNVTCVVPAPVQRLDRIPFMDYVRNVLPNEWVASWPAASLDAGAVAVSQYAWSVAFAKRKWTGRGLPYDVLDSTCDQVYKDRNPHGNYTATDAAVARMWGTALIRNGTTWPFLTTYYRARDDQCGTELDCMGQWGSYARANEGLSGSQILHHYYDRKGVVTEINTAPATRALMLDRSSAVVLQPGEQRTLSICLRNAGTHLWTQSTTTLHTLAPDGAQNSAHTSPFADASWPAPHQPALLPRSNVALGQNSLWTFTIAAPDDLAPGSYDLTLQLRQGENPIATDAPIAWTITVAAPPPELPPQVWLPSVVNGAQPPQVSCS
jgi:hypothetical protein